MVTRIHKAQLFAAAVALSVAHLLPDRALANCGDLLPNEAVATGKTSQLTALDLIELRDVGNPDGSIRSQSPIALSPDGKTIAFLLSRANVATNGYCKALVILPLGHGAKPRIIDHGGEQILSTEVQRGFLVQPGNFAVVRPVWSPDGRSIAYLRRDGGVTQAWVAHLDGQQASAATRSTVDVDAVAWSADGKRLILSSSPQISSMKNDTEEEGRGGWLYDERVVPNMGPRPLIPAGLRTTLFSVNALDGRTAEGAPDDSARMALVNAMAGGSAPDAVASDGSRAWTDPTGPAPLAPRLLKVKRPGTPAVPCNAHACQDGIFGLWWNSTASQLWFLRREGWNRETSTLYRWDVRARRPTRLFSTNDAISGCVMAPAELICNRDGSTRPRRIVRIALDSGRSDTLFDPNPAFGRFRLGTVKRLRWRNAFDLPLWGDLVLPADYRPGTRLPLIVVQYHSDGFLRGGTGDAYPIFLYAAHGFAVLSIERPPFYATKIPNVTDWYQFNAANQKDWRERQSLFSAVSIGVDKVVGMGIADPARVGITGLSDGATTARFALINSDMFAAAAISTCCVEPHTTMTYGGTAWADWLRGMGYPGATEENSGFWRPVSLAKSRDRVKAPLLMQLADSEYLLALEAFTALREAHKPAEMHIFPGEYHKLVEPAHRLASYLRSLAWFQFWLQGRIDEDPVFVRQYDRWKRMKDMHIAEHVGALISPKTVPRPPHPTTP